MLKQRVITASILAILVVWAVLKLPVAGFGVARLVVILLGAWEWTRLVGLNAAHKRGLYVGGVLALILAIWGATVLSFIDNILYPFLAQGEVRLHTLLVFFSAMGGLAVFGFLGFVLGPVVTLLAVTLVKVASEYYSGRPS